MSGPKTYGYTVSDSAMRRYARELERREEARRRAEARQRAEREQRERMERQKLELEARELQDDLARCAEEKALELPEKDAPVSDWKAYLARARDLLRSAATRSEQAATDPAAFFSTLAPENTEPARLYGAEEVIGQGQSAEHPEALAPAEGLAEVRAAVRSAVESFNERYGVPLNDVAMKTMEDALASTDPMISTALLDQLREQLQGLGEVVEKEKEDARSLIERLPGNAPSDEVRQEIEDLRQHLASCANGNARLTDETRRDVADLLSRIESVRAKATAEILNEAFQDHGYVVESIDETLFTEGGKIHLCHSGWRDGYYVRMEVVPDHRRIDMRVVRMDEEPAEGADEAAENAFCEAMPAFAQTLAARGLDISLHRETPAGESPVQMVRPEEIAAHLQRAHESTRREHETTKTERGTNR